jgi:ubiquitin C-terminal hydrolase
MHNSSIISDLFFGTFEYKKQCKICKNTVLDFKKFKFLSFGISKQYEKVFNIYNGFEDNEKAQISSFPCDHCKKYCEFEKSLKIVEPPKELLINIQPHFKESLVIIIDSSLQKLILIK